MVRMPPADPTKEIAGTRSEHRYLETLVRTQVRWPVHRFSVIKEVMQLGVVFEIKLSCFKSYMHILYNLDN